MSRTTRDIAVLCGGVGAARFLGGLVQVVTPDRIVGIVNVGDDSTIHGLHISPDLDTITYTLADAINPGTGWGLRDESWNAMDALRRYAESAGVDPAGAGGEAAGWFSLGDRDLGTHLFRTSRLAAGLTLDQVTTEIIRSWGLELRLVPVTNGSLHTRLETAAGHELSFQEYFVRERHNVEVTGVRFAGAESCAPAPGVLESIATAGAIVIAPSNPAVSIDPVLAVPGIRDAVVASRSRAVAISPIIGGAAIKGPADRLMRELGHESSVVGVARWYAPIAATLVIDRIDAELAPLVEAEGMRCVVTDTVMSEPGVATALARLTIEVAEADRSGDS